MGKEEGKGWKVGRSREVVDGVAAGRIGELVSGVVERRNDTISVPD